MAGRSKVTWEGLPDTSRARGSLVLLLGPGARVTQLSYAESPELRNGAGTVPSGWRDRPPPGPALRVRGERGVRERLAEGGPAREPEKRVRAGWTTC